MPKETRPVGPAPFWYFTCGQYHRHELPGKKVWDKNSVIRVQRQSLDEAHDYVVNRFGNAWAISYTRKEYEQTAHFFPGGVVLTIDIHDSYIKILR